MRMRIQADEGGMPNLEWRHRVNVRKFGIMGKELERRGDF